MKLIPEIVITKTELGKFDSGATYKRVWFEWRGSSQFAGMTYEDNGGWLITNTDYTNSFQEWLDENLDDYDSLETLFGGEPNEEYQKGQDDYQSWLWSAIAEMKASGLYDFATLDELEQRTY